MMSLGLDSSTPEPSSIPVYVWPIPAIVIVGVLACCSDSGSVCVHFLVLAVTHAHCTVHGQGEQGKTAASII